MRYASRRPCAVDPGGATTENWMQKFLYLICVALVALLQIALLPSASATERAIDKEIVVPANVDAAWTAWTTREGIISFFAPDAVVDPRVGGAFQIHINPLAEPGMKGADDMRFLALQPRKMLSFDWNAPPSLPEARQQRTFVVVRLTPVDDKSTRVSIHHTGWGDGGEWDKAYAYFDRAWGNVLINLRKRFETGPMDWTDWLAQLKKMRDDAAKNRDDAAATRK
jgi:uncharacterized protein YndB with AHSA1/START domain